MFRFRLSVILFCTLILFFGCDDPASDDPIIADIAIYARAGSWDASVTAVRAALESSGFSVETITVEDILSDKIINFWLILFPGGDTKEITNALGPVGRMKVRTYISSGGGFVGLGGGAAIADSSTGLWPGLGLFNGVADFPVDIIATPPAYTITSIRLINSFHQIGRNGLEHYQTLYHGGPQFIFSGNEAIDVIYNYVTTGTPAAIAFQFGQGRVFLAGFQPEIEENNDRDDTNFGNELVDADTEWDIIDRAVKFCLWEN